MDKLTAYTRYPLGMGKIGRTREIVCWVVANFDDLESRKNNKNPDWYFTCCDVFCTRNYPGLCEHHLSTKISYTKLGGDKKIETKQDLIQALVRLAEEKLKKGQQAYLPTINSAHFEPYECPALEDKVLKPQTKALLETPLEKEHNKTSDQWKNSALYYERRLDAIHKHYIDEVEDNRLLKAVIHVAQETVKHCDRCFPRLDCITEGFLKF